MGTKKVKVKILLTWECPGCKLMNCRVDYERYLGTKVYLLCRLCYCSIIIKTTMLTRIA